MLFFFKKVRTRQNKICCKSVVLILIVIKLNAECICTQAARISITNHCNPDMLPLTCLKQFWNRRLTAGYFFCHA